MADIEVIDRHIIYENSEPHNRSRHAYFPGLVKLPSNDLLALFIVGEAFEAANCTTSVSRSPDQGRTWKFEGPLHTRDAEHRYHSDYLKPTLLNDGRLIAMGYRFHRDDPDQTIVNPDTDGVREGDNLISFSHDEGRSWADPRIIPGSCPELLEQSGPAIQLRRGTLLGCGSLFPRWDGSNPTGAVGALLKSDDGGETWDDHTRFFEDPKGQCAPSEPRLCEMQDDRVVALVWMHDHVNNRNHTNHVTVSHDAGATWSDPIDTGVAGQASNLMYCQNDLLLTIHCQREGEDVGLFVRLVDFTGDRWQTVEEKKIWGNAPAMKVAAYSSMGQNLKFGQASLLPLENGEILATHWAVEEGQARILTHRLLVGLS